MYVVSPSSNARSRAGVCMQVILGNLQGQFQEIMRQLRPRTADGFATVIPATQLDEGQHPAAHAEVDEHILRLQPAAAVSDSYQPLTVLQGV